MSLSRGADAAARALPTGAVTFLFTDIEGSTRRWEARRPQMEQAVARHEAILRAALAGHGGSVFKTVGDEFCVAFTRPQDAVAAALDAQRALSEEDFSAVDGLRVRMAIHTGTAQEREGDYFGPTVNRVARLLAIGHGGQVLVSGTASDLLQGVMPAQTGLRELGEHQLRDLVRPEQIHQLTAPGLVEVFPALRSLDALPNNLPRQATAFVGRERELTEIKALLAKSQVVTLVGTGGVGKTRTALQVGADLLDGSGDGVWFVDLAQVLAGDFVVSAITAVFGLTIQPDREPLDNLCLHLKNKRLLLILDNCEHVVGETSGVVAAVVKACPRVVVLATSREGLNVHGEQIYRLPSLSLPPRNGALSAQEALKHGAVALFVARASALDAQFAFTDDKAPIVADICRRLDGIALAIELAAARVTILNLKQLSQRLDERFRLLTGGDRTALPRQQTMRAAIDWSYELLSEEERTIFRRLSIFQGGFTLEAAGAVCADDAMDEFKILDILSSLVNKSLVIVDIEAESQRYRLLESLRQYGIDLLRAQEEFDAMAGRHARFFAAYGQQITERWQVLPELAWLAFVEAELDNIRAALRWCLDQGNDPLLGAEIAERLWAYWFGRHTQEGRRWLEMARAAVSPQSDPRLSVALDLALSRAFMGQSWDAAFAAIQRGLAGARLLGDEHVLARAVFYFGEAYTIMGKLDQAEPALIEARDTARRARDPYREAASLQQLAKLYTERKQFDLAREHFAITKRYYQTRGVERNHGLSLIDEAGLERAAGNLVRALQLTQEALAMGQALRDRSLEVIARCSAAAYLVMSEQFEEARAALHESLLMSREDLFGLGLAAALKPCAALASHDGDHERAARLLGYLEADSATRPRSAFVRFDTDWLIETLRDHLGEERLQALKADGATWSQERGFEEALAVC